jgi:putative ABC transport system substrate-binding protein
MVLPGDPVGAGLIKSLAHPGANITGTSLMMPDLGGKRIQLLKEIVPTMRRVAILGNAKNASSAMDMRATETAAKLIGLQVHVVGLDSSDRLESGLEEMVNERPEGVVVVQDSLTLVHAERIAKIALRNRLASIVPGRNYVESGGLAGFGPNLDAIQRRAAVYVDRILKGAKPADLPVEQPTKFELVINLKTAKALGVTIPDTLLTTADEVIE